MRIESANSDEHHEVFKGNNKSPHFTISGCGRDNLNVEAIRDYLYECDWTDKDAPGWITPHFWADVAGFMS